MQYGYNFLDRTDTYVTDNRNVGTATLTHGHNYVVLSRGGVGLGVWSMESDLRPARETRIAIPIGREDFSRAK